MEIKNPSGLRGSRRRKKQNFNLPDSIMARNYKLGFVVSTEFLGKVFDVKIEQRKKTKDAARRTQMRQGVRYGAKMGPCLLNIWLPTTRLETNALFCIF